MPLAVKCDLFFKADDTCLTFQYENVKETEDQLNLNFSSVCVYRQQIKHSSGRK